MKSLIELFAGQIEADSSCEGSFFIKIYHKKTNFAVLVKKVVASIDGDPSHHYENVMNEYFNEGELFVIVGLARIRKKALNLNLESVPTVFTEFLGN